MAAILDIETKRFSNSESPCHPDASHQVFGSILLTVWEEMWFEKIQDGSHIGYLKRRILAILNFYNTPMPPIGSRM